MTVALIAMVKDERDIIEHFLRHAATQVDQILIYDNASTDGTRDVLADVSASLPLVWFDDPEVGYQQSAKMTHLAQIARKNGHEWVVPCDADELWFAPGQHLGAFLSNLGPVALFSSAQLLNHVGTLLDDETEPNPVRRLRWRLREVNPLPKVACRVDPSLRIGMGNHDAQRAGQTWASGRQTVAGELVVHHYPWRSEAQFLRKITNGVRAYAAAPELGDDFGNHWRSFGMPDDPGFEERVVGWYRQWGRRDAIDPAELVEDPA